MKHTLGPWKARKTNDGIYLIESEEGYPIVGEYGWYGNKNTITANAHLIAAAPDLLEACIGLIGILTPKQYSKQFPNIYRKAKAAIAKAEGGLSYENVV